MLKKSLTTLLSLCTLSFDSHAELTSQMREQIEDKIQKYVSQERSGGVAVAIIYPDGLLKEGHRKEVFFYGHTKGDQSPSPNGATLFYLGSVTKVFIATVLGKFIKEGKISLDDPAQKYVPKGVHVPTYNGQQITIRELATHTSSLPRDPSNIRHPGDYQINEFYEFLNHYKLQEPPGTKYLYSNLAFGFLGIILSNIAHMDIQELVVKEMCEPLGMISTGIWYSPEVEEEFRPYFYSKDGKQVFNSRSALLPALAGGGGFSSTLDDMSRFLAFNLGLLHISMNDILPTIHTPAYTIRDHEYMGLGWHEQPIYPQSSTYAFVKNGGLPGVSTAVTFSPQSKTGVVVLSNTAVPTTPLAYGILEIMNSKTKQ